MALPTQWENELENILRGIGGGLVFGIPLLFTMEVWWLGQTAETRHALAVLLFTFLPVFLLVSTSGFRQAVDISRISVFIDASIAIALGMVMSGVVLFVLQRFTVDTPLHVIARMIVFETAPFAVGAAVATEMFSKARGGEQKKQEEKNQAEQSSDEDQGARGTVWDLGATAIGAVFIGLAIAPTEEVPMLASGIERGWLVLVIALALLVTYAIVFVAGFADQERRRKQVGVLQHPMSETAAAYIVCLVTSAIMLWVFDNISLTPWTAALEHAVVLSLPASVGGAAGRLVV